MDIKFTISTQDMETSTLHVGISRSRIEFAGFSDCRKVVIEQEASEVSVSVAIPDTVQPV